jgi:hypothetical protein
VRLEGIPFGVAKIGLVAPFHAQKRKPSTYPTRFFKQFRKGSSQKLVCRLLHIRLARHPLAALVPLEFSKSTTIYCTCA